MTQTVRMRAWRHDSSFTRADCMGIGPFSGLRPFDPTDNGAMRKGGVSSVGARSVR